METMNMRTNKMSFGIRIANVGLLSALLAGLTGCPLQTPATDVVIPGDTTKIASVQATGPTTVDLGADVTYTATAKDAGGQTIGASGVTWSANGSVSISPGAPSTGASVKVRATGIGPGAVTASGNGHTAQIAVRVELGTAKLVVVPADGTTLTTIAGGQMVGLRAAYEGANKVKADATGATWTKTGGCTLLASSGSVIQVRGDANGTCTVTAMSEGMSAMISFMVVQIDSIKIVGAPAGATKLGDKTMLSAVAVSAGADVPNVPVTWTETGGVVTLSKTGNMVTATGVKVGQAALKASVSTTISKDVTFAVDPVSLDIAADGTGVLMGGNAKVTVTPKGTGTFVGTFASATGLSLTGATGFSSVGAPALQGNGLVTFDLVNATADSPTVKVLYGAVTSNALAFTITTVGTVVVTSSSTPAKVGDKVTLTATVKDTKGNPIGGGVPVSWADGSGVFNVPASTDTFSASAMVTKLGTSSVIATVRGVASAALAVPAVPASVTMSALSPTSVPVGGTATTTVSILDVQNQPIAGVTASQVTVTSADTNKVTVSGPVAVGSTFRFTATGAALAAAPGVVLTAKWSNGTEMVSAAAPQSLTVAAGTVTWETGSCVASPTGPKTWRVSGFTGATAGGGAVVYDIYAAAGAAPTLTAASRVAMDGAAGVAKDVTVATVNADWRFAVVARASDGGLSQLVTCTRGATVASTVVAGNAIVLSGAGVYADDTSMKEAATNPRPLLVVAPSTSAVERTAPRPSLSFGGGLVGIGVNEGGAQVLYKRPGSGQGSDSFTLPATPLATVKTDSSNGVCKSRAGITAFELGGKTSAAGALIPFAVFTTTATATGDAADCALNVLAFREGATKTIASGVDRVAAFGDHRLGYTYGGALFDVDLASNSKVPRLLADDALDAGSLIAAVNPASGTAGAIEAQAVFVLSPTGVVSRYTVAAPPFAAPETSAATAALAGADGLVAQNSSTLFVTKGGVLSVVTVSGAGTLTLVVTARDYSMFGANALPVTLGSSSVAVAQ
jgi:hypothetical protein